MMASELTVIIQADDTAFQLAADRVLARLVELRREAEAIKKLQVGASDEVDAVIDGIERLARIERVD